MLLLLRSAACRTFRYILIHGILLAICTWTALPASAQVLPNVAVPSSGPITGLKQQGLYVTAPVTIDGQPVIRIAALASGGSQPIDTRVLLVENAMNQLLAMDPDRGTTIYDPRTFKMSIVREGSQYALEARDDRHPEGVAVVTVTSSDTNAFGLSDKDLAAQWQSQLQSALKAALIKREPQAIRNNILRVVRLLIALAIVTAALVILFLFLQRMMKRMKKRVEERQETLSREAVDTTSAHGESAQQQRRRVLALGMRAAGPEQRLRRYRAYTSGVIWLGIVLWAAAVTWALFLFPQTTPVAQFIVGATGRIIFVWLIAGLVDRLLELAIVRFADAYAHRGDTSEDRARHTLRAPTISSAVGGFKTVVILFVAVLVTLGQLNIPIASVVTIGGIAALAVGFAAQTLVKDVLNGLLVLIEDQYVVGDFVMIGDYNGIVENLSLRVVQLRDLRGYLVTIPHSSVTQVVNGSRNWARVDYRIAIDPGADLKKAIDTLRATLDTLAHDRQWRGSVLEPAEWIGVERVQNTGVVLRVSIRTAPLRQFDVRREINERVFIAYKDAGIALGVDPLGVPTPSPQGSPDPV